MRTSDRSARGVGRVSVTMIGLATLLGTAAIAGAQNECLVEFQDQGGADLEDGASLCGQASGKSCAFSVNLCLNRAEKSCSPGTIKKKVKAKGKPKKGCKVKVQVAPSASATCGSGGAVTVKTKKKGTQPGTCTATVKVKTSDKRTDTDTITFTCNPSSGPSCPTSTSTTTTTTTTSTTTTTIVCANTNCCPSATSLLKFTNSVGAGSCGTVKDGSGAVLFNLACGGLYTGAGAATLSLPASPPDMGLNYTKTSGCSGDSFNLGATTAADLATVAPTNPHRNCTSAGAADPDYPACVGGANAGKPCVIDGDCSGGTCSGTMPGCLFGAPLAIPNPNFAGASVCVVNRVATDASGTGDCRVGTTNLSLPLSSDLYLTGDLLDGSSPSRPNVPGIQPCPLCTAGLCQGGPRHGLACTAATSALTVCESGAKIDHSCSTSADCDGAPCTAARSPYPTTHDCPPPPGPGSSNYIGALPIPFNLSTDQTGTSPAAHKVANTTNLTGQEVFCGFCGAQFSSTFHNPPMPCATDADCAAVTGCPGATACNRCKQRDSGAFGQGASSPNPGAEHEITLMGSPAVCIGDGMPHNSTLVSAFCIPPAYNATVDANGDLPGPGAVSLPGVAQIIP